ncbi:type II/type IV pathway secretion protein [Pseudoclavibacter sp. RFBJ3]|uniref:TadA family conjugal transfer-associated ATPase n=1 Tax=unclassified Pseudoclavibacter TaxID=2615177 RepID=UPI000CE74A18|nr:MULTISPECIES: TadA family conjugal transfer-associated ATPase [unclassified Pseudoclavibacter]MBF4552239.1 TadA family conjugal transfer-associated ATPase [Pseudoclavibacter sp. VKM Ac-2888]PPF82585.1 type II/type IV pathway secretion protein [Pseudoclavibacter sp. RFBJ5]PPF91478.1 type II/type IV pathway secretion protein [Pseudoclavibacter sp. RFBJ3]PPF96402.1 type II/type IV pathway secretion protein [Pseudoclavibacter sp. RFBH5]PPG22148.1 type II/type IV pathway secretion protein [Pseud
MSFTSGSGAAPAQRFVARPAADRAASLTLPPRAGFDDSTPRSVRSLTRGQADAFGPLAGYVADGEVTDLFVNGCDGLYVDRGSGAEREESWLAPSERALRELAVRIVAAGGRHLDESAPCVDVRIADGIRVHAVLPPVSTTGTLLSIRAPKVRQLTLEQLDRQAFFAPGAEELVREAVRTRANVLVTGAGGSGKTTFLAAMLSEADARDRIILIEDVAELRIAHPHSVSLEARQANIEGAGSVPLERLVRESLRMRPDRLVLGECRGAELRELLAALNTGHDGGAGTLHANSLADVPSRLEALGALAGMTPDAVARQTVSAIDLVMHVERTPSGHRRLAEIGEFRLDAAGRLAIATVTRPRGAPGVDVAGSTSLPEAGTGTGTTGTRHREPRRS